MRATWAGSGGEQAHWPAASAVRFWPVSARGRKCEEILVTRVPGHTRNGFYPGVIVFRLRNQDMDQPMASNGRFAVRIGSMEAWQWQSCSGDANRRLGYFCREPMATMNHRNNGPKTFTELGCTPEASMDQKKQRYLIVLLSPVECNS